MVTHIIVPEGLAYEINNQDRKCYLSDYFEAVLNHVLATVPATEAILIALANQFNCAATEEQYAAEYLLKKRPDLNVAIPSGVWDRPYLDTFDNARLLRTWLQEKGL
jgi:hypothetical protein